MFQKYGSKNILELFDKTIELSLPVATGIALYMHINMTQVPYGTYKT